MKKLMPIVLCILLIAGIACALYIEERDYGSKSTENIIAIPAQTLTTLNLVSTSPGGYEILIQNNLPYSVWIGNVRTVTVNRGIALYPSANVTVKGNRNWFGVSAGATSVNVWQAYE